MVFYEPPNTQLNSLVSLTALLSVAGSGKLAAVGCFGIFALTEHIIAPGVRAWRLQTRLQPVPQILTAGFIATTLDVPFAVPRVTSSGTGPEGIIVDVYLTLPGALETDPPVYVDPGDVFLPDTGFIALRVEPGGSASFVAP